MVRRDNSGSHSDSSSLFIIALFIIKLLWWRIIPDLFPEWWPRALWPVRSGGYSAFKLAIVLGLLRGIFKANQNHRAWKKGWKG